MFGPKNTAVDVAAMLAHGLADGSIVLPEQQDEHTVVLRCLDEERRHLLELLRTNFTQSLDPQKSREALKRQEREIEEALERFEKLAVKASRIRNDPDGESTFLRRAPAQ